MRKGRLIWEGVISLIFGILMVLFPDIMVYVFSDNRGLSFLIFILGFVLIGIGALLLLLVVIKGKNE